MKVSYFDSYNSATPSGTISILDWVRNFKYKSQIESLRQIEDKSERDILKAKLPAITPSGTFSYRSENKLIKHSGFIAFDYDKVPIERIPFYKDLIEQMPYTFYCGLSASGRGLWGLFRISQPNFHKKHFRAMMIYFKNQGIELDAAPANVSSLRGYSCDVNAFLNEHAEVFDLIANEPKALKKTIKRKASGFESVADDFNLNGNIEDLLIENGWTYVDTVGTNNRYTRPDKLQGVSANYCTERKLFYVFSTDDAIGLVKGGGRAYNNWSIYVDLKCKGNQTHAAKLLYNEGFGQNENPFKEIIDKETVISSQQADTKPLVSTKKRRYTVPQLEFNFQKLI